MIKANLQWFAKGSSGGGGGGGGGAGGGGTSQKVEKKSVPSSSGKKKESFEDIEKRITDSHGGVKEIVSGQQYDIYNVRGKDETLFSDKVSSAETREYLEGFKYDETAGTFRDKETGRQYRVKLRRK